MKIWKMILINLFSLPLTAAFLGIILFPIAGTIRWMNGWIFIASLLVYIIFYTTYFMIVDPATLERRSKLSTEKGDSLNLVLLGIIFLALMILPPIDFRLKLTQLPLPISIIGTVILLLSYWMLFIVNRQNTYASKGLRIHEGQTVISTGLYGIVRHPLYSAGILMGISLPITLGSLLAVIPALSLPFIFARRIEKEEQMLLRELKGYAEYRDKVQYRLIPGIW